MKQVRQILEMIRFSHTLFALPFAFMSAVMCWLVPAATASDLNVTESIPFRFSQTLVNAAKTPLTFEVKEGGDTSVTLDITEYMLGGR